MTVEIDDAVPMPAKQAWTTAPQPDNVGKEEAAAHELWGNSDLAKPLGEYQQYDLEDAIADFNPGIDYAALQIKATVAAVWFNRKNFLVWFVPTQLGMDQFGWQKRTVVPQLVTEFDAARLRHKCGFKDIGETSLSMLLLNFN